MIDSRPLQRLRHIHQLALTYLIYPGTTHKRFEHSLGVMDLAGRVFDIVVKEALVIARYLIYSQVYFHSIRRICDIHLRDFLTEWLPGGKFSTELESHLSMTDNEVTAALISAAFDSLKPGHDAARRIIRREHFRVLYERNPTDLAINSESASAIFAAAVKQCGAESLRTDKYIQKGGSYEFPVLQRNGEPVSSLALSETLKAIPIFAIDYVFVEPEKRWEAEKWLETNHDSIIKEGRAREDESA